MSVAFRRESDDEHLEPTIELPIPAGPNYVTARGLAQISAKLVDLTAYLDSLTVESEIKAATRELRYWNTGQSTAQLLDKPDGTRVAFGCTVDYARPFALALHALTTNALGQHRAETVSQG